jgi:hypothetical protein
VLAHVHLESRVTSAPLREAQALSCPVAPDGAVTV